MYIAAISIPLKKRERERDPTLAFLLKDWWPGQVVFANCPETQYTLLQVDISTMLEEAVHYVRFLQQQIKVAINRHASSFSSQVR